MPGEGKELYSNSAKMKRKHERLFNNKKKTKQMKIKMIYFAMDLGTHLTLTLVIVHLLSRATRCSVPWFDVSGIRGVDVADG